MKEGRRRRRSRRRKTTCVKWKGFECIQFLWFHTLTHTHNKNKSKFFQTCDMNLIFFFVFININWISFFRSPEKKNIIVPKNHKITQKCTADTSLCYENPNTKLINPETLVFFHLQPKKYLNKTAIWCISPSSF